MTTEPERESAAVKAELHEWVTALNETVSTLYSEIDRIRSGGLIPKGGSDGAAGEAEPNRR